MAAARARMYRELVFETAERIFAGKGYESTTMQDIAAEAGISLKTLYATFPGKRDLYREIARVRGHEFVEHALAALREDGTPLEILARGVHAYVDFLLTHREFFRIQLRSARAWGLSPDSEATVDWHAGVQMQAELLRRGIAQGLFYEGDPELTAATVISIIQVQLAGLLERKPEPDARAISDEILRQITRYLVKPDELRPPGPVAAG